MPSPHPAGSRSGRRRRDVDGHPIPAQRLDTDHLVYAVAASLPEGGILSAVVPRPPLPLVDLEFVTARLD